MQAERIQSALQILTQRLTQLSIPHNPSLMSAEGGLALFYAYMHLYKKDEKYRNEAIHLIEAGVNHLSAHDHSLAEGYTGFAWLIHHITGEGIFEVNDTTMVNTLDEFICGAIEKDVDKKNYDLLYGLIGKSVYFFEREGGSISEKHIQTIVNHLIDMSIKTSEGITWQDNFTMTTPSINLGLSHGIPSIIIFLSKVHHAGLLTENHIHYLDQAVNWLLKQRNDYAYSCFPHYQGAKEPSRLGWGYGDLGIALALLYAYSCRGNESWKKEALNIALRAAERTVPESHAYHDHEGVYDAGFCNGFSGISRIFNKLYLATHHERLKTASDFWLDMALSSIEKIKDVPVEEEAGPVKRWRNDVSLIKGLPGIGLILLAHLNPQYCGWERLFFTDLPVPVC